MDLLTFQAKLTDICNLAEQAQSQNEDGLYVFTSYDRGLAHPSWEHQAVALEQLFDRLKALQAEISEGSANATH